MGKLKEKIKGVIEKVSGDTFKYDRRSICCLDAEPSSEEEIQEISQRVEGRQCPNCGRCDIADFEKSPDGKLICRNCGLALTPAVKAKYGI
jgi:hypothetical protein